MSVLLSAARGERIAADDAVGFFEDASLAELAWAAGTRCDELHPDGVRTYVIDRNINYTNICVSGCRFCAFYKTPGDPGGYVLTHEQIIEKIREAVDLGATQVLIQGGLNPDLKITWFEELLCTIKNHFDMQVHSLSAPEIVHLSRISGLSIRRTIERLHAAGLDSLPGGGAELLVDRVREKVSPAKCSASEWLEVIHEAAAVGMRGTATMLFGMGETFRDRVEHLTKIRDAQDDTGFFTAFIPWTYQPGNTALGGEPAGGHDYLRTLAISRLFIDNIANIQASWVTQGEAIAELALRFGANDAGSTMIEENVVAAAGVSYMMDEKCLIELIHRAGYDAARRTTLYELIEAHPRHKESPGDRPGLSE